MFFFCGTQIRIYPLFYQNTAFQEHCILESGSVSILRCKGVGKNILCCTYQLKLFFAINWFSPVASGLNLLLHNNNNYYFIVSLGLYSAFFPTLKQNLMQTHCSLNCAIFYVHQNHQWNSTCLYLTNCYVTSSAEALFQAGCDSADATLSTHSGGSSLC